MLGDFRQTLEAVPCHANASLRQAFGEMFSQHFQVDRVVFDDQQQGGFGRHQRRGIDPRSDVVLHAAELDAPVATRRLPAPKHPLVQPALDRGDRHAQALGGGQRGDGGRETGWIVPDGGRLVDHQKCDVRSMLALAASPVGNRAAIA